jgi:sugar lactone lactonase YvrE
VCVLALLGTSGQVRAADVVVSGSTDFPESMSAGADGTLYFSSLAGGRIFRAAPGATQAREWIKPGSNGLDSALGVLADSKTNTLYVCSDDMSFAGITLPTGETPTALKTFDLKSGAAKASYVLPESTLPDQKAFCNDIAVGGTAYVADSRSGHILRLKPGGSALEIWAHDARWDVKGFQLDGIAVLPDGSVYANIGLYRVVVKPDGSAGTITKLKTSRSLFHSDGLRAAGNRLLMVEGETRGFLDLITVSGDDATVKTVKEGFEGPVSLAQVGVYVLDVPLKYLFDPKAKTQKPPPFTAFAVKSPE